MAYQAGDSITGDQYNIFVNNSSSPYGYNHFAGTGSGVYGLGQTHIATVTGGSTTITASQWNTLFTSIDNIANHTNDEGSMTTRSQVSAGDTIAIKAAVEADLATLAASVAAGCPNADAVSEGSALQTSDSATRWAGSHTVEHSITFANNNDLRHFFNAGGLIRIKTSRVTGGHSDGSVSGKDGSMDELLAAVDDIDIGSVSTARGASGETTTENGLTNGVSDLTTSYLTLLHVTQDNGSYSGNMSIKFEAKANTSDYDTMTVVTVKVTLDDAESGVLSADDDAQSDGEYTAPGSPVAPGQVDQYDNFIGQTRVATHPVNPTTGQGLASVASVSTSAAPTNSTVNAD
jgi:hypothetical protein